MYENHAMSLSNCFLTNHTATWPLLFTNWLSGFIEVLKMAPRTHMKEFSLLPIELAFTDLEGQLCFQTH